MEKKRKPKSKQIYLRVDDEQLKRLNEVADLLESTDPRNRRPDMAEIIRSMIGWGNRNLLNADERAYIAGDISSLHGKRNKP